MAQVTLTNPILSNRHLAGDVVVRYFTVSGATGSTLNTNMADILFVSIQQSTAAGTISLITSFAVNTVTGVITFTSSGTMVTEVIAVEARVG